jgi:hypothetical protein
MENKEMMTMMMMKFLSLQILGYKMSLERIGGVLIAERNFVSKSILRSSELWPHVVWYVDTYVLKVHTAEIIRVKVRQVINVGGYTEAKKLETDDRGSHSYLEIGKRKRGAK